MGRALGRNFGRRCEVVLSGDGGEDVHLILNLSTENALSAVHCLSKKLMFIGVNDKL